MKTREQIYGQEAAGILRDVSMYRALTEMQLLKLYPHKESKIRNLLSYLQKQGRIVQRGETVQHVLVGPKDLTIHFCQLKFFRCHRIYPFLNKFSLIITQKIAKSNKNIEKINANEIN